MNKWFNTFFCVVLLLISNPGNGLQAQYIRIDSGPFTTPYTPSGRPRIAAEWEPAIGVLIAWPPALPHKLIIELAKDSKLYVVVENRTSQKQAIDWFTKWGIFPDRVKFITAPMDVDAWWTRDWGPHAVFAPDGSMRLADPKYIYSTPVSGLSCDDTLEFIFHDEQGNVAKTIIDDRIPEHISQSTGFDLIPLPFAFTGGNVISDGQRTVFSSCIITNENRYMDIADEKFFHDARQLLGVEKYNVISNFEEEGIQHIDCYMKLLDEERILVMRPPADHPAFDQYEGIVNHELSVLTNAWGRPYQILRLDTDRFNGDELAAYSNSLILNQIVYVPLFGISQDSVAMKQWRTAMPGYTIKGFEFKIADEPFLDPEARTHYQSLGWRGGDALHCRARAIWDPSMIYLSVNRLPDEVPYLEHYTIDVIARDYSNAGLRDQGIKLMWREAGETDWREKTLGKGVLEDHYSVVINNPGPGKTIEYFISAETQAGKKQTIPVVAPKGFYTSTIGAKK
jgi:agmatine/peptidylarginine deiminase